MRCSKWFTFLSAAILWACGSEYTTRSAKSVSCPTEQLLDGSFTEEIQLPSNQGAAAEAKHRPLLGRSSEYGVLFVTGVDGGYIEPVDGIYGRVAQAISIRGMHSIFVKYRYPGEIETSVLDAKAAAEHLKEAGVTRIIVIGWSFGGAVAIQLATKVPEIISIVNIAPQARDTEPVSDLTKQSLLLLHSYDDENVPFEASEDILQRAPEAIRKQLIPFSGADHYLSGLEKQVDPIVLKWIERETTLTTPISSPQAPCNI